MLSTAAFLILDGSWAWLQVRGASGAVALHELGFLVGYGACKYVLLKGGTDLTVDMVAANNVHHGSHEPLMLTTHSFWGAREPEIVYFTLKRGAKEPRGSPKPQVS